MVGQAFVDLVEELKGTMSILTICAHMGVARATYYRWRKQRGILSNKDSRDQAIGEACAAHRNIVMAIVKSLLYFQKSQKKRYKE